MRSLFPLLTGAAMLLATAGVSAHEGHAHGGLAAGLMHPVGGIDHLLATVGIGLVAGLALRAGASPGGVRGQLGRGALAAGLGLAAGAALASAGALLPGLSGGLAELGVAAGLLALAVALLAGERLGARGLAAFALALGVPHGALHALEGTGAGFFVGLALASAALFALGALAGRGLAAAPRASVGRARWALAAGYLGGFSWFAAVALR
jgi:urease accessory protein